MRAQEINLFILITVLILIFIFFCYCITLLSLRRETKKSIERAKNKKLSKEFMLKIENFKY